MNTETKYESSLDAEYALIGWVLANNKIMTIVGDLKADDFYSEPHCDIFQAIEVLNRNGEGISPFTIMPLLKNKDVFDISGGCIKYLSGALVASNTYPMPEILAVHIIKLAKDRRFKQACSNAVDMKIEEAAPLIIKAANEATTDKKRINLKNNYEVSIEILEDLKNETKPFSTGMANLDEAMGGGLYTGKSYGFAARKKVGKTSLASTVSHNLNMSGIKHLFICGEMSAKEIHQRVLARQTQSFTSAFRSDYGQSPDFSMKIARATHDMPKNVLYSDAPALTFDELKQIVLGAHERYKIQGFILDYWQLVGGKGKSQSTAEHLDEVAQWIADICRKIGVWSITMAQINQEGNTRGGEGIRLAFDQLYQLHRPDLSQPDAWLEMMETRYTQWMNIGDEHNAGMLMRDHGQYFSEV